MKKAMYITLAVVVVILLILIITPFFINVDNFRPQIEQALGEKLGRKVEIGHLTVSLLSGSLRADQISIADDPAYSRGPFVMAQSLSVGVDVMPLILSRQLHVHSLELGNPKVQLLRTTSGEWNFATLGASAKGDPAPNVKDDPPGDPPAPSASAAALNNFSVDKVRISNGTISFGRAGERSRLAYQDVNISADNVSQAAAFPLTFAARTPGGGRLNLDTRVGPIGNGDANRMPFEGKMKADNVPAPDVQDLLAVLGYSLPQGSSLKGGTIKADLALHGPLEKLVTDGPVQLSNVTLAGFSLASKLGEALGNAGAATGNDTLIQVASSKLRYAPEGVRADELNIVIPAIGSVTGAGTVAANNAMDFRLVAKLAGNSPLAALTKIPLFSKDGGIPFRVRGTTAKPEVVPEIGGNAVQQLMNPNQPGGLGGIIGGLLKKKKPNPQPQP
ncbi:MAG TPA: AsmA family protein [Candidatus Acidoferrales bacterium]|nr:AsmA family protein [Candidatus Acidoferrales bacterium]